VIFCDCHSAIREYCVTQQSAALLQYNIVYTPSSSSASFTSSEQPMPHLLMPVTTPWRVRDILEVFILHHHRQG
jgi:hypothetical protein